MPRRSDSNPESRAEFVESHYKEVEAGKRVYECQLCNAPDKRNFFCEKGIRTSYPSALSHIEKIHDKTFEAWLQEKRARKRETENTVDSLMSSPIKLSKVFEKMIKWKCDHGVSNAAIQDPLFKWLKGADFFCTTPFTKKYYFFYLYINYIKLFGPLNFKVISTESFSHSWYALFIHGMPFSKRFLKDACKRLARSLASAERR